LCPLGVRTAQGGFAAGNGPEDTSESAVLAGWQASALPRSPPAFLRNTYLPPDLMMGELPCVQSIVEENQWKVCKLEVV
jgi:hypothetical protein